MTFLSSLSQWAIPGLIGASGPNRFLISLAIGLVIFLGCGLGLFQLLSLSQRRHERARLFLRLLELGLRRGHSPETTIKAISSSRDRCLGLGFHLLADHLQECEPLHRGLAQVPTLLPARLQAMLIMAGESMDYDRVLPACHRVLRDEERRHGRVPIALVALGIMPLLVFLGWIVQRVILLRWVQVLGELSPNTWATLSLWLPLLQGLWWLLLGIVLAFATVFLASAFLRRWPVGRWVTQELDWRLSWRRKRLQRDFAALLAELLNAGVTEAQALRLAARGTGHTRWQRAAESAVTALGLGQSLPEVLSRLEGAQDLRWLLLQSRGHSFFSSLDGWLESLDARAFQEASAASQLGGVLLVLLNGLLVGGLMVFLFYGLTGLIGEALL